jgi:hypothetical protein
VAGEEGGSPVLYDLTVSYPDDAFLEETERREGICCKGGGTIRLKEEPVFCWIRLNEDGQPQDAKQKQEILSDMRIVLARTEVLNCQLNKAISIAQRLSARPSKQPYICCREAAPEGRTWLIATCAPRQLVPSKAQGVSLARNLLFFPVVLPFGLKQEIDTSECGFLTTPCYSARISDPRVKLFTQEGATKDEAGSGAFSFMCLVDGLVQIVNPRPDKFNAQILLIAQFLFPETGAHDATLLSLGGPHSSFSFLSDANARASLIARLESMDVEAKIQDLIDQSFNDWHLVWMGVEG